MTKVKKMYSGNKGEWSEVYVVLKLLADGKLFSADGNMEKIEDVFFRVLKILREESKTNTSIEYLINGSIKIVDGNTQKELLELPTKKFVEKASEFFDKLKEKKTRSFQIPEFETFLREIYINSLKTKSQNKADITLVVEDRVTKGSLGVSFSIKSLVGKDPTLLNPAAGTNFIYKITHPDAKKINVDDFNAKTYSKRAVKGNSKITKRLKELEDLGYEIVFQKVQSETFQLNLELVDSNLPRILSYMLLYKYMYNMSKTMDLLGLIEEKNPLKYNYKHNHPFYRYKVKGLLYDYALGMTPEKPWTGDYAATGGIIIVKDDGEALCYRVYDKNIFQNYLLENTRFEQASTGEDDDNPGHPRVNADESEDDAENGKSKTYYFGWLYEENNELFIKLNLQVRFIKSGKKAKVVMPEKLIF